MANEECEWTFTLPNHQNEFMFEIEIKASFPANTRDQNYITVELPNGAFGNHPYYHLMVFIVLYASEVFELLSFSRSA